MKLKFILLAIMGLSICNSAKAQILKKLTKKAEQAAERTILNKTDEVVTETTEKAIDGATTPSENNNKTENSQNTTETTNRNTQANSTVNPMASKKATTSQLPDSYAFDWELKMEMSNSKGEKVNMNYLLNSGTKDYAGMEMSNAQSKHKGNMRMVMDAKAQSMVMFMEASGQKMGQVRKMPETNKKVKDEEFTYKEIGTKTILGYECFGIEVENKGYKATMYYTLDAPVTFSSFFNFANDSTPKGFDPALVEVMKEDALLLEMNAVDKNKSKDSFTLTAISLDKKETVIKKGDYQFMGF